MILKGQWNMPTHVECGADTILKLGTLCRKWHISRPMLVTDQGLKSSEMIQNAFNILEKEGISATLFSEVTSNPKTTQIMLGVAHYQEDKHDGIIAIGGGSALDAGKAIAFMAKQTYPLHVFVDEGDNYLRANAEFDPIIAVPTTAGTGSEVGRCAVILDEERAQKLIIFHPNMMPKSVILDPLLTVNLPPHLTAYTGMDALSHNLEAYCVQAFSPLHDAFAIYGIELVHHNLTLAAEQPNHVEARTHMLLASMLGACAFQKGLGAMHALSHALGALYDLHHGMLNAVLMPFVLQFNQTAIENKITSLALRMRLKDASFKGFMNWILGLRETLEIPHCLEALNLDIHPERIIELAVHDPSGFGNPIPLDKSNLKQLLTYAVKGNCDF